MVNQAKKCKKGYSCGAGCINVKKVCRKALTGQAVTLADNYFELAKKANQTTVSGGGQAVEDITPEEALQWEKDLANQAMGWDQPSEKNRLEDPDKKTSDLDNQIESDSKDSVNKQEQITKYSELTESFEYPNPDKEENLRKLDSIANGESLTEAEKQEVYEAAMGLMFVPKGKESVMEDKVNFILEADSNLDVTDALSLRNWSGANYYNINKDIYNGENEKGKLVGRGLQEALVKAKKIDSQELQEMRKQSEEQGKPTRDEDSEYLLQRHSNITTGSIVSALGGYIEANKTGDGIYHEPTFTPTTIQDWTSEGNTSEFSENANVVYNIKPKLDGSGKGVNVDKFKPEGKAYATEGEILFPALTGFKVNGFSLKDENGNEIDLEGLTSEETMKIVQKALSQKGFKFELFLEEV